jgi:hypothetical protein
MAMKKTKSYSYILPMVSNEVIDIKKSLINVFIGDENYPELDSHIFLLYKFIGSREFLAFEEEISHSSLFERSYDTDKLHTMKVLKVPKWYKEDFDTFKKSKFSQFSLPYKKLIISFHDLGKKHQIYGVLYKEEFAYKTLEKELNKGLPYSSHIIIDRDLEASGLIDLETEKYKNKFSVKDPFIEMQQNFTTKKYDSKENL